MYPKFPGTAKTLPSLFPGMAKSLPSQGFGDCEFANFVLRISELTASHLSNKNYLKKVKCSIQIRLSSVLIVFIIRKIVYHI